MIALVKLGVGFTQDIVRGVKEFKSALASVDNAVHAKGDTSARGEQ